MKIKLLLAGFTTAIFLVGQAVAYPGAKTTPSSGNTVQEKSQRTNPSEGNGNQPNNSGDYLYSHSERSTKVLPDDPATSVPEPGTLILVGLGLAGGAYLRRKRNKV